MSASDTSGDRRELARGLHDFARDIAQCLADAQHGDGSFPARDFYGKSFSALLWSEWPDDFQTNIEAALTAIAAEEKPTRGPGKYHFEFNRYALLGMKLSAARINGLLGGERYARTRVANWTLLRASCRLRSRNLLQRLVGKLEAAFVLLYFRRQGQLIEDQRDAFTAQYHFLCVAMLFEIDRSWLQGRSRWLNKVLTGAADTICRLTMPNGECNYLGRGKFQSFGYGAAILALCRAYRSFGDPAYLETAHRIFNHVRSFKRDDGSLPLVLSPTGRPEGPPDQVDPAKPDYAGWYSYNNYFDYLPFIAALFAIAADELDGADGSSGDNDASGAETSAYDRTEILSDVLMVDTDRYRAVVTLPNNVWAASQPLPYIGLQSGCPLPAFGGENAGGGSYSAADIPTPVMHAEEDEPDHTSMLCDFGSYKWISPSRMRGRWAQGIHEREFVWNENGFTVHDTILNAGTRRWSCEIIRLPLPEDTSLLDRGVLRIRNGVKISAAGPIAKLNATVFGPDGPMEVFGIVLSLDAGTRIEEKITYDFN